MEDNATPELLHCMTEGKLFALYSGRLRTDGARVLVKMPSGKGDRAHAASLLDGEFAITRMIDHPDMLVASHRIETDGGPMLVYDDAGLLPLPRAVGLPLPSDLLETTARRLAAVLAALHRSGIVHRNLKPDHIVVSEDLEIFRLTEFSAATRTEDAGRSPDPVSGDNDPAYSAPELSGRVNRKADHRADLYALGVVLYELATGLNPFLDPDPANVIHRHLTEMPRPPHEVDRDISSVMSDAIMRLLEKNPEDRFQSAADFLGALREGGPAQASSHFSLPDRLYGRREMLDRLSHILTANPGGKSRLIRVAGHSGAGKSALIAQLIKPAVETGANFVQGKFDQLDRAQPYGAFLQAFDMLLRRLLAGSPENVETWRMRLLDALSPNGQVLLDIMPRYRLLIGPQPPVPKLGLNEARIRVSLVFRRFVGALARADSPLILFLDDLQWSDSASRSLIELLLTDPEIRHLTILTAYRDNEVGPGHPATLMFTTLEERIGLEPTIAVGPLAVDHVAELVADSLGVDADSARPLAEIISAKTAGNPFFIRQFLFALVRRGLVFHDGETGRWRWDNDRSAMEQFTSNVADLVIDRIVSLPEATQEIVLLAACSGNNFETSVLALVSGRSQAEIGQLLETAIANSVVQPADEDDQGQRIRYRFQHDRVQQAAHDLLPPRRRGLLHARIGAILLENIHEGQSRLIEITDHLIAGQDHLDDALRLRLRGLALDAARQTMSANAYDATLRYLDAAERTLEGKAWEIAPDLAFQIALERAQTAYLQNRITMAEDIAADLIARGLDPLDEVRVLELMILLHTSQLNYRQALQVGKRALVLLGESLPLSPGLTRVLGELVATKIRLARTSDGNLLTLPKMQDARKLAAMRVLVLLAPPAYFSAPNLLPVIALRMVRLSVRYGNAPHSAYGYAIYAMLHCAVLGDIQRGQAYGELARRSADELGAQDIEGRVLMVFAGFVRHWAVPLSETLPIFLEGADKSISAGDLEYHGYNRYAHASYALMGGQQLTRVSNYLEQHLAAVTDSRHEKTRRIITMARASIGRMRGIVDDPFADAFDETENFELWTEQADATSLAYFHKYKLLEALMAGDYRETLARTRSMTANLNGILSMAFQPFYQFYEALALIELSGSASFWRRRSMLLRAHTLARRLERWARHAPSNFSHRAVLLRAELARAAGRTETAMRLFDRAVAGARSAGALHDVGLFLERAARFYRASGAADQAAVNVAAASAAHGNWGAGGWSESLKKRYPDLFELAAVQESGAASRNGDVDSATLIRAAAALAQKTSLQDVVLEVMRAIVVNAGATRGVLLLCEGDAISLAAEATADGRVSMARERLAADEAKIPISIVNYVRNSSDRVVLDDAVADETFGSDPCIASGHPLSVLCVPLVSKGATIGVVYLENERLRGAFTPDRCHTAEVLGAQAAVSLENARLFDELRGALERQVDLTTAHARFVPHTFLELLGRTSIADVRLGDHLRVEASILFCDIRGFTTLLERLDPKDAIEFINAYLTRMEPAVQASGGFIESYYGDAVMAVFGQGPEAAIDAGIAMAQVLQRWSVQRVREGHEPIRIGIGIATGEMIFGTIGSANRLSCGVIGDTVNLASRIEGLTKFYGAGIIITEATYKGLPDPSRYQIREIDLVTVVGRKTPERIFEVFDSDSDELKNQKMQTATAIKEGLGLYRAGEISSALSVFEDCHARAPDDPLAQMLMQRCQRERDVVHDLDWDGIERMKSK